MTTERATRGVGILSVLLAILSGCAPADETSRARTRPERTDASLVVYVVNEPLRYFAERVGGDRVTVVLPAPAGVDPSLWSPAPEVAAVYQGADLILLNGGGYAQWVSRASLPRARLIDTSAAFADRLITLKGGPAHGHGPGGAHAHARTAAHVWLDLALALAQASAVRDAFASARPALASEFAEGFSSLEADLRALDERLTRAARSLGDSGLVFSHPVYPYFERRYGLSGPSLHWEPEEQPSETQWRQLESLLAGRPAELLLFEGSPLPETAARLHALGLQVVVYEPAGSRSERGDWLERMRENVKRLELAAVR